MLIYNISCDYYSAPYTILTTPKLPTIQLPSQLKPTLHPSQPQNEQPLQGPVRPTATPSPKHPSQLHNTNNPQSGGSGASEKFQKQQAEKQGHGATNAPGHTDGHRPGEAPVASDSGATNVGQHPAGNNPGTQGIQGEPVSSKPEGAGSNMK